MKQAFIRNLLNFAGWHTKRKIVIIESDDWGSIRMRSREVYNSLLKNGIRVNELPYQRFDSLESEVDLSSLFEVLHSVKDSIGNPAIFTANTIMANPDFDKIAASAYNQYFFEDFTSTYLRYGYDNAFKVMHQGINAGVFYPQFHGREHLNVQRWLRALSEDIGLTRLAFRHQMFDLSTSLRISENSFMEALNFERNDEILFQEKVLNEGLTMFEKVFGYRSKTFIAPCYVWSRVLHTTLEKQGVLGLQGSSVQFEPQGFGNPNNFRKIRNFTGKSAGGNLHYLVRNVTFEPVLEKGNSVEKALSQVENAFFWGKPAIITSHRVNYVGGLEPKNREIHLKELNRLLKAMLIKWPNIEFWSSDRLAQQIFSEKLKYQIYDATEQGI